MTCVVGIEMGKSVILGADSAWGTEDFIAPAKTPKVFRKGELVVGFATNWVFGLLVCHRFVPPPIGRDLHRLDHYMNSRFADALNNMLADEGISTVPEGGALMVGVRGELYEVDGELCAVRASGWSAIGAGEMIAAGSLYTSEGLGLSPHERLRLALESAAAYAPTVCPPFMYASNSPIRLPAAKRAKRVRK